MILTDDEIRKAAEFAAEQMWPESGYVGWTEDDAEFFRKFTDALIDKLRAGVELPEPYDGEQSVFEDWLHDCAPSGDAESVQAQWLASFEYRSFVEKHEFTCDQLLAYGDARALAAREQQWLPIESAPEDGTAVLLYFPHKDLVIRGAWEWQGEGNWESGQQDWKDWCTDNDVVIQEDPSYAPTHWAPCLPPPPASPQEQA